MDPPPELIADLKARALRSMRPAATIAPPPPTFYPTTQFLPSSLQQMGGPTFHSPPTNLMFPPRFQPPNFPLPPGFFPNQTPPPFINGNVDFHFPPPPQDDSHYMNNGGPVTALEVAPPPFPPSLPTRQLNYRDVDFQVEDPEALRRSARDIPMEVSNQPQAPTTQSGNLWSTSAKTTIVQEETDFAALLQHHVTRKGNYSPSRKNKSQRRRPHQHQREKQRPTAEGSGPLPPSLATAYYAPLLPPPPPPTQLPPPTPSNLPPPSPQRHCSHQTNGNGKEEDDEDEEEGIFIDPFPTHTHRQSTVSLNSSLPQEEQPMSISPPGTPAPPTEKPILPRRKSPITTLSLSSSSTSATMTPTTTRFGQSATVRSNKHAQNPTLVINLDYSDEEDGDYADSSERGKQKETRRVDQLPKQTGIETELQRRKALKKEAQAEALRVLQQQIAEKKEKLRREKKAHRQIEEASAMISAMASAKAKTQSKPKENEQATTKSIVSSPTSSFSPPPTSNSTPFSTASSKTIRPHADLAAQKQWIESQQNEIRAGQTNLEDLEGQLSRASRLVSEHGNRKGLLEAKVQTLRQQLVAMESLLDTCTKEEKRAQDDVLSLQREVDSQRKLLTEKQSIVDKSLLHLYELEIEAQMNPIVQLSSPPRKVPQAPSESEMAALKAQLLQSLAPKAEASALVNTQTPMTPSRTANAFTATAVTTTASPVIQPITPTNIPAKRTPPKNNVAPQQKAEALPQPVASKAITASSKASPTQPTLKPSTTSTQPTPSLPKASGKLIKITLRKKKGAKKRPLTVSSVVQDWLRKAINFFQMGLLTTSYSLYDRQKSVFQSQAGDTTPKLLPERDMEVSLPAPLPDNVLNQDYESPLKCLQSYRTSPLYVQRYPFASMTFSNKIDPLSVICRFELHGVCNDDDCQWQHVRDYELKDTEIWTSLALYVEKLKDSEVRGEELMTRALEAVKRLSHGSSNIELVAREIVSQLSPEKRHTLLTPVLGFLQQKPHVTEKKARKAQKEEDERPARKPRKDTKKDVEVDTESSQMIDSFIPLYDRVKTGEDEYEDEGQDAGAKWQFELGSTDEGVSNQDRRYYFSQASLDQYTASLESDPHNIQMWINYALERGSGELGKLEREQTDGVLQALSAALEKNPTSVEIWKLYLSLFKDRATTPEQTREMYDQAFRYCTLQHSSVLWNMLIAFSKKISEKAINVEKAVTSLNDLHKCGVDPDISAVVANMLLHQMRLEFEAAEKKMSVTRICAVLFSELEVRDLCARFPEDLAPPPQNLLHTQICMTDESLTTLCSYLVYGLMFDLIPSVSYSPNGSPKPITISDWSVVLSLPATKVDLIRTIYRAVLRKFEPKFTRCLSVCKDAIRFELTLPNIEAARFLCQSFLKSDSTEKTFWKLYADVEEKFGVLRDVVLIYRTILDSDNQKKQPKAFSLWHANASLYLRGPSPSVSSALSVLCRSVLQFVKEETPLTNSGESVPPSTIERARFAFWRAIKMPIAEETKEYVDLIFLQAEPAENVFLLLNYCLFEILSGSDDSVIETAFEHALSSTTTLDDRQAVWLQYLRWRVSTNTTEQQYLKLLNTLVEETKNNALIHFPTPGLSPSFLKDSRISLVVADTKTKDYKFFDEVLQLIEPHINKRKLLDVYDRLHQIFMDNQFVCLKASEAYFACGNVRSAKKVLSETLRVLPESVPCWISDINLVLFEGDAEEARELFKKATGYNPFSLELWRQYVTFQKSTGVDGNRLETLLDEAAITVNISTLI